MGGKKDHGYVLIEFKSIKRKPDGVVDFIKRFNKMYNSLPVEIKPPHVGAKVLFTGVFESKFGFTLRERRSITLDEIQTNAVEIEANLSAALKIKQKDEAIDKNKGKEKARPSNQSKYLHEKKLDEIAKVIRNMSNNLVKLELDNKNPPR